MNNQYFQGISDSDKSFMPNKKHDFKINEINYSLKSSNFDRVEKTMNRIS